MPEAAVAPSQSFDPFVALGVDRSALNSTLSPQIGADSIKAPAQRSGIDPFAALGVAPGNYPPTRVPGAPQGAGLAQNFAAGANRTIFNTVGWPVDIATQALNATSRGISHLLGVQPPQIQHPVGGSEWLSSEWGNLTGTNPQNVQPTNEAERIAAATGSGVASVPLMGLEGAAAAPAIRAGGEMLSRAAPSLAPRITSAANTAANVSRSFVDVPMGSPGLETAANNVSRFAPTPLRPAIVKLGAAASKLPVGMVPQSVVAGAVGGQALADAVPAQYAPLANLAGNLAVGGGLAGVEAGLAGAGRYAAEKLGAAGIGPKAPLLGPDGAPLAGSNGNPLRVTGTQRNIVAQRLASAAGPDLAKVQDILQNAPGQLVPGSAPTTAQLAPVPGLVGLEQAHRVASPEPFNARAAAQNSARLASISSHAPADASPAAVGDWFRQQLAAADQAGRVGLAARAGDIGAQTGALGGVSTPEQLAAPVQQAVEAVRSPFEAAATQDVAAAQAGRSEALGALPGGRQAIPGGATVPEQYGAEVRGQAMQGRAAESAAVSRLQGLIDPDGTAGVEAAPFQQAISDVYANRPRAEAPLSTEEQAVRQIATGWGNGLVPLSEVFALRQRVGDAISDMLAPGSTATRPVARLQAVKSALDDALANTAAHQAEYEAQEVSAGRMGAGDTIFGRLQQSPANEQSSTLGTASARSGASVAGNAAAAGEAAAAGNRGNLGARSAGLGIGAGNSGLAPTAGARGRAPESLTDYLISKGGIQDQGSDLKAIGADAVHHKAGGRLVSPRGLTPDYARELAEGEGFLRPNSTISDLYDAIAEHIAGRPVYRISEQAEGTLHFQAAREAELHRVAMERAGWRVSEVENGAGLRLTQGEHDHAAMLVANGMHPEEAVRQAMLPGDLTALDRNAQSSAFTAPGMPAGAVETPLGLSGGGPGGRNLRPMTAEQLAAHRAYLARAANLKQTYDAGAVGEVLGFGEHPTAADVGLSRQRGGFQYSDAQVLGRILTRGVTEAEATRQALAAGIKPETLTAALADDLRANAVGADGNLDLKSYAKWRREHGGAIHALGGNVAKAFDSAAHAQQTLEAAEANARAVAESHPLRGVEQQQVLGRYFKPGDEGAAAVRQFARDTGGDAAARSALRDYAVYRLRSEGAVNPDGTVDAAALDRFTGKYRRALDEMPELSRRLSSVRDAQRALDDATAAHERALRDYENGVAKNFLHDDPLVAVRKAFGSGNPADTFGRLVEMVRGNPDAEAGLRRAVVDYISERAHSARPANESEDFLKADVFRRFIRQHAKPLKTLFGGQGVNNFDMVAADLRRGAYSGVSAPGSPTATYAASVKRHGLVPGGHVGGGVGVSVLALLGEHAGELAGEHQLLGAVALPALGIAANSLKQAGIRTINDLERFAMLHPSVARELVARIGPDGAVGQVRQQRLARAIQAVLGAHVARQVGSAVQ